MYPCLFSSQIPFLFTSDSSLKFVEVHHEFLRHQWLHDIKLGDWNCLTTWPLSRVFSRVLKRAELVQVACFVNIIPWTRIKKTNFLSPITRQNMRKVNRDLERNSRILFRPSLGKTQVEMRGGNLTIPRQKARQNMRKMNRDLGWIQEYFLVLTK